MAIAAAAAAASTAAHDIGPTTWRRFSLGDPEAIQPAPASTAAIAAHTAAGIHDRVSHHSFATISAAHTTSATKRALPMRRVTAGSTTRNCSCADRAIAVLTRSITRV